MNLVARFLLNVRAHITSRGLRRLAEIGDSVDGRGEGGPERRRCDLLLRGCVLVAAPDRVVPDGALAVVAGRIADVGGTDALAARWDPAAELSADGGIVLPGLVNVHGHSPLTIVRGVAEDLGFAPAYTPRIPQGYALSEEEAHALARLGLWELLRCGSTTVADHYRFPEAIARAAAEIGLRAFVGGRIHDADMRGVAYGRWSHDVSIGRETLDENLRFAEAWRDRDPMIRPLICPHAPDTCTQDLLREVADASDGLRLQAHIHLAQSAAEVERVRARDGVSPAELLDDCGLLGPSTVAAHCIHMTPDDVRRVGAAGVTVAHAPIGNASHGEIAPVPALARAGARIALCTDTKSGDMFEAMRTALAVARIREGARAVRAPDVLAWATASGSAALGCGSGALDPGEPADVLVLDAEAPNLAPVLSPVGSVVHNGTGLNVRHVVVAGEILVRDGRSTRTDTAALLRDARSVASRLWEAAGLPLPTDARWI